MNTHSWHLGVILLLAGHFASILFFYASTRVNFSV